MPRLLLFLTRSQPDNRIRKPLLAYLEAWQLVMRAGFLLKKRGEP